MRAGALVAALAVLAGCAAPTRTGIPQLPGGGPIAARSAERMAEDTLAGRFAVYTADGRPASLDAVVAALGTADAVFLGEEHTDAVTHVLQLRLLEAAHARYSLLRTEGPRSGTRSGGAARPVALGLEMFERDVQLVLDEYLAGHIRERDFLAAARPWGNHVAHYHPMVEWAQERGLPVLATNAPGRYVNLVAREGEGALAGLSPAARVLLPRRVAPASGALAAKFRAQMAAMAGPHGVAPHGGAGPSIDHLLAAQNLRDAAMAEAVARWLGANRGGLVVHVNGRFHSEAGLGIPEHLARYRPGARALVVTFRPTEDITAAPAPSPGDDFVVLTLREAGGDE